MTITAYRQRRDMIGLLVYRPHRDIIGVAIMAALTIASDPRVREVQSRLERFCGGVANDTVLGRRQMVAGLSGTDVTVVTGHAIVKNARVAEYCPGKGSCAEVAIDAILVVGDGRYVVNGLARTDHIVVASRAAIIDIGMIIGAGTKCARGVANTTIQKCRHMGIGRGARRHTTRRARSIGNMTGEPAITDDAGMVEPADEGIGAVAGAAIGGGRWMGIRRG